MSIKREKILQKLNPRLLKTTPRLSGDTGSFIDLDFEDSLEDGAKKLMMRFFRNQDLCEKSKRNLPQSETELIISSAKYNENHEICELISERLTLPSICNDEGNLSDKPGRRLQILQMQLEEKMSAKWEEEYKKRLKENKFHIESKLKYKKKHSDGDEYGDNHLNKKKTSEEEKEKGFKGELDEEEYDKGDNLHVEFENNDDYENNESELASIISDDEIIDNYSEHNNENNFIKDDDNESCSLVPAYQPGGGMLYGGSELTQYEEELPHNLLSPSLRLSMNDSYASKMSTEFHGINEPTLKESECSNDELGSLAMKTKLFFQNPNDSFDLSDAFEFCSGKFPGEKSESQLATQTLIEGNLHVINEDRNKDDRDCKTAFSHTLDSKLEENKLEDLTFEKENLKVRKNIIVFESSEEGEEEEEEEIMNDTKINKPVETALVLVSDDEDESTVCNKFIRKKKIRKNLHFSDEEDAKNDYENEESAYDKSDESASGEDEYDNEEKEEDKDDQSSVQYDSEENEIINPKEFFEKEAELSGSEWSGDEDEKDMDEFDVEEGDADNINHDEVRSQLEKIHIRRVLDDDAREVRMIQEILFEDGDLHSDGKRRDRKFKWKNIGTFDEQDGEERTKEDGTNSSEDDGEEEALRKLRYEKELFFMGKKKDGELSSDDEIVENLLGVKVTTVKTSIKISANSENKITNARTITDCTKISKMTDVSNSRGSFLTRNEQFLSKLAKTTLGVSDNVLGPKNSKNFVFATKSPEKPNPDKSGVYKRQIADTETYNRREKKIKLLQPDIGTGPSILDLLV